MTKRGVISIETIIIIILALITLVVVAAAFTGGMKQLWDKISGISSAIPEADKIAAQTTCKGYCEQGLVDEFKTHKFSGSLEKETCASLTGLSESQCTAMKK